MTKAGKCNTALENILKKKYLENIKKIFFDE